MTIRHTDVPRGSAFCVVEILMDNGIANYLLVREKKVEGRISMWKNPGGRYDSNKDLDSRHGFRGTALREIREELDLDGKIGFELDDIGERVYETLKDPDSDSPHVFVVFRVQITEDDLNGVEIFREEIEAYYDFNVEEVQKMVADRLHHCSGGTILEYHAKALHEALTENSDPWDDVAAEYTAV